MVFNVDMGTTNIIDPSITHGRPMNSARAFLNDRQHDGRVEDLVEIANEYHRLYEEADKSLCSNRAKAYREFTKKTISHKNGQAIHRILKKKADVIARPVFGYAPMTTADQAHADEQIDQWSKVWQVNDQQVDNVRDSNDFVTDPKKSVNARLEHVTHEEVTNLRRIINSFSVDTAGGHDNEPPRCMANLTDTILKCLIAFDRRVEAEARWPETWR